METATVATVATVAGSGKNGCFLRVTANCRNTVATFAATLRADRLNLAIVGRVSSIFLGFWCPEPAGNGGGGHPPAKAEGVSPRSTDFWGLMQGQCDEW